MGFTFSFLSGSTINKEKSTIVLPFPLLIGMTKYSVHFHSWVREAERVIQDEID